MFYFCHITVTTLHWLWLVNTSYFKAAFSVTPSLQETFLWRKITYSGPPADFQEKQNRNDSVISKNDHGEHMQL